MRNYAEKLVKTKVQYRKASFDRQAIDEDTRTASLSFSSESPVERFFGIEILDHSPGSIRTEFIGSGRAPVLYSHDPTDVIGVVETVSFSPDRGGRATVRFGKSARAEEKFQDVVDGILSNVSVGYFAYEQVQEGLNDGVPTFRITDWEPIEVSIVSIPADTSVGVGRNDERTVETRVKELVPEEEEETTEPGPEAREPDVDASETEKEIEVREPDHKSDNPNKEEKAEMADENGKDVTLTDDERKAQVTEVRDREVARVRKIQSLGEQYDCRDKAKEFVDKGYEPDKFREWILDNKYPETKPTKVNDTVDMSANEKRQYSILKAMKAMRDRDWSNAGFEREISQDLANRFGKEPRGLYVPADVFMKRDITHTGDGAGLIGVDHTPERFIEFLRPRLTTGQAGIQVVGGLEGDLRIPRQTSGSSVSWVTEGNDVSETNFATDTVTLTPKTMGARTDITRTMLLQSSPAVESLVRADLLRSVAQELDRVVLEGSGSSGQPTGVFNASINTVTSGTLDFADIVNLEGEVATDNADLGSLAYITTSAIRSTLKQTEKASNTAQFIWVDTAPGVGEMNSYPAYATNVFTAQLVPLLFGNWNDVIVGQWGGVDLFVDPYTLGDSGGLVVRIFMDIDVGIRHVESFAKLTV